MPSQGGQGAASRARRDSLPGAQRLRPSLLVGPPSRPVFPLGFIFPEGNGRFSKLHEIAFSDLIPRTLEQV